MNQCFYEVVYYKPLMTIHVFVMKVFTTRDKCLGGMAWNGLTMTIGQL
jgi:hypothetical protein